ncbi:MAG: MgtC/SapB family protein [Candidatus Kerfeldbacteria bacterium]|nr:MgtC/SapB family protein [Candidatus Kerfeldbacteria bacterium]
MFDAPEALLQLLVTSLLSGLIGLERHVAHRPAGVRTNILVGVGSALVMMLALRLSEGADSIDPGRFAGQVLTGIGFIGAGVMFRFRGEPQGVTTAATIFVVACMGLAIGAGEYLLGVATGVIVLVTLRVVGAIEHRHEKHDHHD